MSLTFVDSMKDLRCDGVTSRIKWGDVKKVGFGVPQEFYGVPNY